jgi:hypothetical protein
MKTLILLGVLVLTAASFGSAYAQVLQNDIKIHRPDFSGKWKLSVAKSRFRRPPGASSRPEMSWIWLIEQNLPAIHITTRSQFGVADDANFSGGKFTLYTDGRGDEFVPGTFSHSRSFSEWKSNKLVQTLYESSARDSVLCTQEFDLAPDNKTFTITMKDIAVVYDETSKIKRTIDDSQADYLVFDRIGP